MSIYRPVTLITGASAGIGAALAHVFAAAGYEIALVARREAELSVLAAEIAAAHVVPHVLPFDLLRSDTPARISHELLARGLEPAIIVNNAGFGLLGPAAALDRGEQLAMIDLNIRALTDLSLRWIDSAARHGGGILNVASLAGFLPGPNMAVYYATKAYVLSFTEALHEELRPRGVRVTALCPGPVPTEFQRRAGIQRTGGLPRTMVRSADLVARAGYEGFIAGRSLVIPGLANKLVALMPRFVPRSVMLAAVGASSRRLGPRAAASWLKRPPRA
jgi:uncharacterized protein